MRTVELVLRIMLVLLAIAGCERPPEPVLSEKEAIRRNLVWPQPPMRPRIRFERAVKQPVDLGIAPTFWQRVKELVAGKEEEWFVRPTGVAAAGPLILVADPGAQSLWILDAAAKRYRRIREAGEQALASPVSVAPGKDDRIYLADSFLGKVFVFTRGGKLERTIAAADLKRPSGLAYDLLRDRLYVADSAAHRVWIFDGEDKMIKAIGRRGEGDGEFNFPTHVAVDGAGTIFVTDSLGFRVQFFSPEGGFLGRFGKHGDSSGEFARPKGVAVDSEGHIYVVEALFDAVQIFDRSGRYLLTFGDRGLGFGQFWLPGSIFIDPQDRIYVADSYNQRIQIFKFLAEGKK